MSHYKNNVGVHVSGIIFVLLGYGCPASADAPPDFTIKFAPGIACQFELQIEGWGGTRRVKEFKDENGNRVRLLEAGPSSALRFTNVTSHQTYSTESKGSISQIRYNLNGSYTETDSGHSLFILYPTAQTTDPSTRLIAGSVVYTVDSLGVFSMGEINGKTTDICALFPS